MGNGKQIHITTVPAEVHQTAASIQNTLHDKTQFIGAKMQLYDQKTFG